MPKKKPLKQNSEAKPSGAKEDKTPRTADGHAVTKEGHIVGSFTVAREIVESIAIAFVLAFLFKTFEAEAFVIPTGSMAPTLMGRHKDFECPQCGYRYRVGASSEVNQRTNRRDPGHGIVTGTCPICRYTASIGEVNPQSEQYNSYKGDRILVSKFPYEYRNPERWEVAVFHFPGEATKNYIKRIVGLPNETLRITKGDIWTKASDEDTFRIQRKPPKQLRTMLQIVYDNDYAVPKLREAGWPTRWASGLGVDGRPAWTTEDYRRFATDGKRPGARLVYRHFVPTSEEWDYLEQGKSPPGLASVRPQLITDFVAYNSGVDKGSAGAIGDRRGGFRPFGENYGLNWVGDLAVECDLDVRSETGTIVLELVEGGVLFQCRIDVATGRAELVIPGRQDAEQPAADTRIQGPGDYRVLFSNVDDELRLWVDGRPVEFDHPATYDSRGETRPTVEDLAPVRIGADGATVEVDHLKVYRDIYYIASKHRDTGKRDQIRPQFPASHVINGGHIGESGRVATEKDVRNVLADPQEWGWLGETRQAEFEIGPDQFFACGDNSPASLDGRIWSGNFNIPHTVDRKYLIGKALLVYWPHGWEIPGVGMPWFPNFGQMRLIH